MKPLRAWALRIAGLFRAARRDREFTAELDSHLQMHIADNLRAGMTPLEARRVALLKLGGMEPTRQAYRERGTVPYLEHLLQDLRFAFRQLLKSPAFAATAILMLALGICASLSIFAFVDAALIKPLPYPNPSRLDILLTYDHPSIPDRVRYCLTYDPWGNGGHGEFVH